MHIKFLIFKSFHVICVPYLIIQMKNLINRNKINLILLLSFFCFLNSFGQNKIGAEIQKLQRENVTFTPISLLTIDESIPKTTINQVVRNATVAKLNPNQLGQMASNPLDFVALVVPYQNQNITILLYRVNPFAEGFSIDTDKEKNIFYQKGIHYRGIIKGNLNSVSAFNFFNNEFNGIISSQELGNIVVGKIDKPNNQNDYIIYSDANFLVENNFECHVKDSGLPLTAASSLNREASTIKCVTFYYEIDHTIFLSNNSSSALTANWVTSMFNNVQTLFTNDGITTALNSVFIWTNPDIYQNVGTSSSAYLTAFKNFRPFISSDVGMLVGIDPGGLGGVAYLNGLCTDFNYGYSDLNSIAIATVPTYSWTTQVMTHELGHLMGSPHTHACIWNGTNTPIDGCGSQAGYPENGCTIIGPIPTPSDKGTIMSYCHLTQGVGISFANGFGVQPATLMANTINAKACLSTDCTNCNNTISSIVANFISNNSAVIVWEDFGNAESYQVSVRQFTASTVWNTVDQPTFQATGLLPNTYYRVRIRPVCTSTSPKIREYIFATSANFCEGTTFLDTGGAANNYTNLQSWTRTITPNLPNNKITVSFTQFSLEPAYDYLYIYDGPNDSFPEFNSGDGFTGLDSPGIVTSTAVDGSLTFKFTSDQIVTGPGWQANVTCQESLSISTQDYIDFMYYPNPTTNTVTLKSNTLITAIEVFNIEGRKLFTQKLETLECNIDLEPFAAGTYFLKVKFNEVEKNVKVLKM